ncbi:hypothetical protein OIU76_002728 [Salix suchowensis]|uniref:Uncharacterized protein n=1 Tax=Salix suchowensis TaxID=1278906 RepID=A0ABQ9CH60_9ROSI|nr:hypothetical protein OIU76_002728 [Salix suchowensis]KAJ6397855.1 hypothetical protein OIU77_018797 [Salix suchowensis]
MASTCFRFFLVGSFVFIIVLFPFSHFLLHSHQSLLRLLVGLEVVATPLQPIQQVPQ